MTQWLHYPCKYAIQLPECAIPASTPTHKKSGWQYLGNAQRPAGVKPTGFLRAFQISLLFDDSTVGILGYCPVNI